MKENELRKNNLVEYSDGGGFVELNTLEIHRIDIGQVQVKPIALTEEWLLRCGKKINESSFELDKFIVLKSVCGKFLIHSNNKLIQIEFVHDLQNFYYYFENTKTELTFNNG